MFPVVVKSVRTPRGDPHDDGRRHSVRGRFGHLDAREDFVADTAAIRDVLEENGFHELPVVAQHAVALSTLPPIHADPFDRMLVAQSIAEPMVLITSDERLAAYPGTIEVV